MIEPHALERELPWWYIHSWDHSRDAQRSFRLDRMRDVRLLDETFEPRPDLEPAKLRDVRTARVLFRKKIAPWRIERGARPLADGTALEEMRHGSVEWIVGEILSYRGQAVVVEPEELRAAVAARARALVKPLGKRRRANALRADGKPDGERRAVAFPGVDLERAAVRLGDRARDEEAEAGAGRRARARLRGAAELLEDDALLVLGDSRARDR